jgi:hypothetical protein
MPHGTPRMYGKAMFIREVVQLSGVPPRDGLSPRCMENNFNDF